MNQENELQQADQKEVEFYSGTHIEVLEMYLANAGEGIQLSKYQEKILSRLTFTDEKIRQNNGRFKRAEIANMIIAKFGVNRGTAFKDIVNAEHLFSSSYPINKRYRIGIRIEFLEEEIRKAAAQQQWDSVARMEKVLCSYYEIYPDITPQRVKKNFFFVVENNFFSTADNNNGKEMSVEDAIIISENENENDE